VIVVDPVKQIEVAEQIAVEQIVVKKAVVVVVWVQIVEAMLEVV